MVLLLSKWVVSANTVKKSHQGEESLKKFAETTLEDEDYLKYSFILSDASKRYQLRLDSSSKIFSNNYLNLTTLNPQSAKSTSKGSIRFSLNLKKGLKSKEVPKPCKKKIRQIHHKFDFLAFDPASKECFGFSSNNFVHMRALGQSEAGFPSLICFGVGYEAAWLSSSGKRRGGRNTFQQHQDSSIVDQKKLSLSAKNPIQEFCIKPISEKNEENEQEKDNSNPGLTIESLNPPPDQHKTAKKHTRRLQTSHTKKLRVVLQVPKNSLKLLKLTKSDYNIHLRDQRKHHSIYLNQHSLLANHPIIKQKSRHIIFSINFKSPLTPGQFPDTKPCNLLSRTLKANYVIHIKHDLCIHGSFNKLPFLYYKGADLERGRGPSVTMTLHSSPHIKFFVTLVGHHRLGMKKFKIYHHVFEKGAYYINFNDVLLPAEASEYKNLAKKIHEKLLKICFGGTLFVTPVVFVLPFSKDVSFRQFYMLQFGIVFNFLSQLDLGLLEMFDLEDQFYTIIPTLILAFYVAVGLSKRKKYVLVVLWKLLTLGDYFVTAVLMRSKETLYYCLINILIFKTLGFVYKLVNPKVSLVELGISFTVNLSLLNLANNLIYFTTPFSRVMMVMDGQILHNNDPAFYYLGLGIIFTILSFGRMVMLQILPWNVRVRRVRELDKAVRGTGDGDIEMAVNDINVSASAVSDNGGGVSADVSISSLTEANGWY